MRYHCEGTVPHIAVAWPSLIAPGRNGDQFYAMGSHGYAELAAKGKSQYHYGILDYNELLKSRGLDSSKLAYHPFRDDGKVLWDEFQDFANAFVEMFYKTDSDVASDSEIQSYANEVSADGKIAPFGGRGKITGFPSRFSSKAQLELFVTRFVWLVSMHTAVNYPIEPWLSFLPLSPPKLNADERARKNTRYLYPDAQTTIGGTGYATLLGNLRINRIMDYSSKITHCELSRLVAYHHRRLHSEVQRKLGMRSAERKERLQMGFQYFEPKWLTNSIHV